MKNIKKIEEIRIDIDKIDIEILSLIEKRKKLVDRVVKLKTKDEIVDQIRIDKILSKIDLEAKKKNASLRNDQKYMGKNDKWFY